MIEDRCNLKQVAMFVVFNFLYVCGHEKISEMVYILSWAPILPINNLDLEGRAFYDRKCPIQNCYITNDSSYFSNIQQFDAIIFNVVNLRERLTDISIPSYRSKKQLYIFFSQESPENYPLYEDYNDFFNLTWSYKLDSSIVIPFLQIMDKREQKIGPHLSLRWKEYESMKPVERHVKHKLQNKTVAATWFVSNCYSENNRYEFAQKLQYELNEYEHRVDIYGECGSLQCPKNRADECDAIIESDYYFYLAFENSFADDYVTDQLLHAVQNLAIPVVYGGANYSRFLPPESYLDGRALGPRKLAKKMFNLIKHPVQYYKYFKWHNYYTFLSTIEMAYKVEICELCAVLNERLNSKQKSMLPNIVQWWNGNYSIYPLN